MINPDDSDEVEGAYGDSPAIQFRPVAAYDYLTEPTDTMDNISLEVQFGEDDSRHVSEISSVSYQNLLDEGEASICESDKDTVMRRDSEESEDIDDCQFAPIDVTTMNPLHTMSTNDSESPMTSPDDPPSSQFTMSQTHDAIGDHSGVTDSEVFTNNILLRNRHLLNARSDSGPPHDNSPNTTTETTDTTNNCVLTRDVNSGYTEKINCDVINTGAKPKVHKMSPGVARRVTHPAEDVPKVQGESVIDKLKAATLQDFLTAHNIRSDIADSQSDKSSSQNSCVAVPSAADKLEIENEYNYVKYARIQQGNSYVGMRLAYSSTNDLNAPNPTEKQNGKAHSLESPPDRGKANSSTGSFSDGTYMNEDSLTEIPLNGTDGHDNGRAFSLSPDNTEGESQEVESVISDCEKSSLGMPLVEDGLSSSGNSDSDAPRRKQMKKQRHKRRTSKRSDDDASDIRSRELDAQAIMADLKAKREALDSAIMDIKTAIQQSKGVSLKSPNLQHDNRANEPVWVKRGAVEPVDHEEEMRVAREEIERHEEDEYARREQEKAHQEEAKNIKMKSQRMRMRAKASHLPQNAAGFDSDEEDESLTHRFRRCRGKKYASLPSDDGRNNNHSNSRASNGMSYGSASSEEYLSDEGGGTTYKYSYVKVKTDADYDTDEETDKLLDKPHKKPETAVDVPEQRKIHKEGRSTRAHEVLTLRDPDTDQTVLIEGVLFRARYLGSTQLVVEGQPSKAMRMMQAQEAVGRIKAPAGESQPSTEVDLFVSTEKIMVLNTDLQEIMMDHALRTISYIADIADILVIMARRSIIKSPEGEALRRKKQAKILCHVFESDESQLIAQSIGQAFQVAYLEFLKANGIEDPGMKEMDIQDVLNQQEIYGDELSLFANKDYHKEVIVPKSKGEPLGVVIVESGWGSMVPTVVLANMAPCGAAARCGQLNIGDQIISVNGISLVGLPLSSCQNYIKNGKQQTVVKLTVVPCPPVVEVLIKRPDVKYQLGFSVQNGVISVPHPEVTEDYMPLGVDEDNLYQICSLLRGGIAERGGIRVGHRIIEINSQSVVAVPHEKIVSLLAHSVGEIHMKTMPTSIFRLLTGQDTPHYL